MTDFRVRIVPTSTYYVRSNESDTAISASYALSSSRSEVTKTADTASYAVNFNVSGSITASLFKGDGSLLTGVVAASSGGITVQEDGVIEGVATHVSFDSGLNVSVVSSTASVSLVSGVVSSSQQINTGSFSGSFKGSGVELTGLVSASHALTSNTSISSSYAITSSHTTGIVTSASYAISTSFAANAGASTWNDITGKPSGLVSGSSQFNTLTDPFTGSFTGSFRGIHIGDGSQLTGVVASGVGITVADDEATQGNAARVSFNGPGLVATVSSNTASISLSGVVSSSGQFNTLTDPFTGSFTGSLNGNIVSSLTTPFTGSFTGSGAGLIGVVTSSYAVSSSHANNAGNIEWTSVSNKPSNLISSSAQFTDINSPFTGSFTGSFKGSGVNIIGVVSSSYASTASVVNGGQITGSFTGSFRGAFVGDGSGLTGVVAASSGGVEIADDASPQGVAQRLDFVSGITATVTSATASINLVSGVISSSTQFNNLDSPFTGSYTGSFRGLLHPITGSLIVSGSQKVTGSLIVSNSLHVHGGITGSYTGSLTGTIISSLTTPFTGSFTGSFTGNASGLVGVVSASHASTSVTASHALSASYFSGSINLPSGLDITGSLNISGSTTSISASGNITASGFNGNGRFITGVISSSYAVTASHLTGTIASASYAITASSSEKSFTATSSSYALTASFALNGGGSTTGSFTGSFSGSMTGSLSGIISSSLTTPFTGSYTGSLTGKVISSLTTPFTGSFTGSGAGLTGVVSSSYAITASHLTGTITSASYATTASSAERTFTATSASIAQTSSYFSGSINLPSGLDVTGSLKVSGSVGTGISASGWISSSTGFHGSGTYVTGVVSSSYAVTASHALNSVGGTTTGSFTGSFSGSFTGSLNGVVVSSLTTPFTGSFTGSFKGDGSQLTGITVTSASYAITASHLTGTITSASYAVTASSAEISFSSSYALTASYVDGNVTFPNGLDVTGSLLVTGSISASGVISSSGIYSSTGLSEVNWSIISSSRTGSNNSGYIVGSGSLTTVYLPLTSSTGVKMRLINTGSGLFRVAQAVSQSVRFGAITSSVGTSGYVQAQNIGDSLELICITPNLTWFVISSVGTFTVN